MSTYKALIGKYVRSVSSDPSTSYGEGEIWYNTDSNTFKTVIPIGAWASGGNMNTGASSNAGFGIQTSAVSAGGNTRSGQSEEYNGSSWTSLPSMPRSQPAFIFGGCGVETAGITAGGMPGGQGQVATSDEWNGSSWTGGGNMNTARQGCRLFGTSAAAVVTGGRNDPGPIMNTIELYNGSSWTASPLSMSSTRYNHGAGGTNTAGIVFGGSPGRNQTEIYDGEGWTSGGNMPTGWADMASGGNQTSAMAAGGRNPSTTNNAAVYDGTAWATIANMATTISDLAGSSNTPTSGSFVAFGGARSGVPGAKNTEEFSTAATVRTLTTS